MRRLGVLAITLLTAGSFAYAEACTGEVLLGNPMTTVDDLTAVQGSVNACVTARYEHPNLCCQAGPNLSPTCGAYLLSPFSPCPSGNHFATYPDPRYCCSVDDPSKCEAAPTAASGLDTSSCSSACPLGQYQDDGGACCSSGGCAAPATPVACSVPDCSPNEPCPTEPSCDAGSSCGSCLSGFSAPDGGGPLCCEGATACYSQAVTVAVGVVDGGSSVTPTIDSGVSDAGPVVPPISPSDASVGVVELPDAGPD